MVKIKSMKQRLIHPYLPPLIALICLFLTLVGWFLTSRSVDLYNSTRFRRMATKVEADIAFRMETYVNALAQTRNMISVSPYLTRRAFKKYVESLNFQTQYPGVEGIGYVERIRDYDLKSHISQSRSEGIANYQVWPLDKKKFYYAITYLEPLSENNQKLLGYELSSNPILSKAISDAGRSNAPISSGIVKLADQSENHRAEEFLILVPLYRNESQVITPAQRERNLVGFLVSTFRASALFNGIFKSTESDERVGFMAYVGEAKPENLFYKSHDRPLHSSYNRNYKIAVAGQTWMLEVYSLPNFQSKSYEWIPWLSLCVGILITLLIYFSLRSYWKFTVILSKRSAENANLYRQTQEAVVIRDDFMSIASHELRTPITSLKMQMELVAKKFNQPGEVDKDKILYLVSSAQKQVGRLIGLIDNLLDASRVTAGKLVLNKELVDISGLSFDVVERLKLLDSRGPEISTSITPSLSGNFDKLRLEQIMINLLTNAIKYGDGKPVSFTVQDEQGWLSIKVKDNGIGIAPEDLTKVFDRYERIRNQARAQGLGLGLYILKQIVNAHGGEVQVESEVGSGSTFTVTLPLN